MAETVHHSIRSHRAPRSPRTGWRRHAQWWGAVYILAALWLGSAAAHAAALWRTQADDAAAHGQPHGWADYWPALVSSTAENWQSEWAQLTVQALLLLSPLASRVWRADRNADKDDVARIEAQLAELRTAITDREV
ncbi:hypothetical protein ACIBTV_27895 [Micromonospora sp. NPDC049366]|uniref:hypothetical protein n=1 Tax=Micromonospora sp. NPDC049366 TaxID=3364271 RepID=UPI0037A8EEC5